MSTETGDSPLACAERREESERVREALERLDKPHRLILTLREYDGLDYQTIAEILDVQIGTVRSRLSRARAQLKWTLLGAEATASR